MNLIVLSLLFMKILMEILLRVLKVVMQYKSISGIGMEI